MKKPSNRKERIDFICQKKGQRGKDIFTYMTDRDLKKYFDMVYPLLKDNPDATEEDDKVRCVRCGIGVETHLHCFCGVDRAVFSEEEWKDDIENCSWSEMRSRDEVFIEKGFRIIDELVD